MNIKSSTTKKKFVRGDKELKPKPKRYVRINRMDDRRSKQNAFIASFLKHFNIAKAAKDIGCKSTAIAQGYLRDPYVIDIMQDHFSKRMEVAQVNADWVLQKAKLVYERCMQEAPVTIKGEPTGEWKFNSAGALGALKIIGDHVQVQAFLIKHQHTGGIDLKINVQEVKSLKKSLSVKELEKLDALLAKTGGFGSEEDPGEGIGLNRISGKKSSSFYAAGMAYN